MVRAAPLPWEEAYRRQGRLWRGDRLDEATAALLAAEPGLQKGRWLDAGCGDGKGLIPLAQRIGAGGLVGADRSIWGLRLVREAGGAAGRRIVRADAAAWPFRDATFAAVRAVHLVGHVDAETRQQVVAELGRVTRPGGFVIVVDFGTGDFRYGTGEEVAPGTFRRGVGIVTHYFAAGELERLVTDAGLEVSSMTAERFEVTYGGKRRPRERWRVVARRKDQPGV